MNFDVSEFYEKLSGHVNFHFEWAHISLNSYRRKNGTEVVEKYEVHILGPVHFSIFEIIKNEFYEDTSELSFSSVSRGLQSAVAVLPTVDCLKIRCVVFC
jgi:hypothetical protein